MYGGPELDREQMGVGLQIIILFGCLFAPHIRGIYVHIAAYFTTIRWRYRSGFVAGIATLFSNVIGLIQAPVIVVYTTYDDNFIGFDTTTY